MTTDHTDAAGAGPRPTYRDQRGVAKYRHEVLAVVVRASGTQLEVLVKDRCREPFTGMPALPGGPLEVNETMEQAVVRHLRDFLDVSLLGHREQLSTLSEPGRDPFERTVATTYLGLVAPDVQANGGARWLPVRESGPMAFDHAHAVEEAVVRLCGKVSYTNIAHALAPAEFTLAQLRDIYCACLGYDVDVTNLSRVLRRRGQIVKTGHLAESGQRGGRPPATWTFTRHDYEVTDPFAVLRPASRDKQSRTSRGLGCEVL
ncbi:NUDIX domain-containing protein [Cutibacterium sp.]|uniref:NUDIX hydrolase n=1 Tax=Cutibacterium sp. TaxID=1912221 RepID=UPI0026DD01B5|nr:NUDIX domain-containing protein [Cutibacterium sp.]MDO4411768.1 NUDIX domain-containing protein [Cutibacterium sp.]